MTTESIAWPRARQARRPLVDRLHDWVTTVDHKKIGIMYVALRARVPRHRRHRGDADADPARPCRTITSLLAAGLQPHVHDARHDDDLLRGHADPVRLRQLPGAAHDRRARHGVPAPERLQLLADRVRRPAPLLQLHRRQRPLRRRQRARRRLVRLRAAHAPRRSRAATAPTTGRCRSWSRASAASAPRSTS